MDDKMIQKVWMLLDIIHKAAGAGPAYQWLVDMAAAEVNKMKPTPEPTPEPAVVPAASVPNGNGLASQRLAPSSPSPTSDDDGEDNV